MPQSHYPATGYPVLPLINVKCPNKSQLGFDQGSNPKPPSPKASTVQR